MLPRQKPGFGKCKELGCDLSDISSVHFCTFFRIFSFSGDFLPSNTLRSKDNGAFHPREKNHT